MDITTILLTHFFLNQLKYWVNRKSLREVDRKNLISYKEHNIARSWQKHLRGNMVRLWEEERGQGEQEALSSHVMKRQIIASFEWEPQYAEADGFECNIFKNESFLNKPLFPKDWNPWLKKIYAESKTTAWTCIHCLRKMEKRNWIHFF